MRNSERRINNIFLYSNNAMVDTLEILEGTALQRSFFDIGS
jgi:hypothetical protein